MQSTNSFAKSRVKHKNFDTESP